MKNVNNQLVSVRIPVSVLFAVEHYCSKNPFGISRSAAIVYLISRGLHEQGFKVKE